MRIQLHRRICGFAFTVAILLFLLTLYMLSVKQSNIRSPFNIRQRALNRYVNTQYGGENGKWAGQTAAGYVFEGNASDYGRQHVGGEVSRPGGDVKNDGTEYLEGVHHKAPVDVYIVEEHHEVLPYWFAAARHGTLAATGNTLIHIDGHSDLAPPMLVPGYPEFQMPTSPRQLRYLMQKNDAFIQAASMAGLISRVVWVWPDWDAPNHEDLYSMGTLSMGWAEVGRAGGAPQRAFCMCQTYGDDVQCQYQDLYSEEGWEGVTIPHADCHVRRMIIMEEVNENKALKLFSKKDWVTDSEHVILDIDEDFYGCTYAIEPLLKVNVTFTMARDIDEIVASIFCPATTRGEHEADRILVKTVALVRQQQRCLSENTDSTSHINTSLACPDVVTEANPKKYFISLLRSAISKQFRNIAFLCGDFSDTALHIDRFLIKLSTLQTIQLKALEYVGFCSSTTPKSFRLFGEPEFRICYGANTPNVSVVTVHNPSKQETVKRSVLLNKLLERVQRLSPDLVTVCRSVRDGYTPRHRFNQIESDILCGLNSTLRRDIKIHYDIDLLGGKTGWPSRYDN